jgi:Na+-transporting NADH:ubiquinone oxidoreductase subunit NqrE
MTAVYSLWAAEFCLEAFGAVLYSNRSKLLSVLLVSCAMSDAVTFSILRFVNPYAYAWSYWGARSLKYAMLILVACSICGMFVAEVHRFQATATAFIVSLCSAALITAVSASGETLKDKLLDGEIAANMILLGMVFLGWIGRRDRLDSTWKWIACGFMVMVGSDLIFTALWTFWDGARHFYPLGAISAQLIWVAGPLNALRIEKRVNEQVDFGRFLIAEDRNPVENRLVM